MVDLESLAQMCREKNRWTFFVTSAPANVPGEELITANFFPTSDRANTGQQVA